jgi:hypothetical protein
MDIKLNPTSQCSSPLCECDGLSNFQFTTHLWHPYFKNFIHSMKMIKLVTWFNHMESHNLISTKIFIKIKNHFRFFSIFTFFNIMLHVLFSHEYILSSHKIKF